jgi:hypothetical protein
LNKGPNKVRVWSCPVIKDGLIYVARAVSCVVRSTIPAGVLGTCQVCNSVDWRVEVVHANSQEPGTSAELPCIANLPQPVEDPFWQEVRLRPAVRYRRWPV